LRRIRTSLIYGREKNKRIKNTFEFCWLNVCFYLPSLRTSN
jgi:hypothetical protein